MQPWLSLPVIVGVGVVILILGLAAVILIKIFTDRIDISQLLAEPDGKASLSRFQFLVFTFVIAGVYLLLCIESGTFVEIPASVLGLMGISSGSYVVSKGIGANVANTAVKAGASSPAPAEPPAPPAAPPEA